MRDPHYELHPADGKREEGVSRHRDGSRSAWQAGSTIDLLKITPEPAITALAFAFILCLGCWERMAQRYSLGSVDGIRDDPQIAALPRGLPCQNTPDDGRTVLLQEEATAL